MNDLTFYQRIQIETVMKSHLVTIKNYEEFLNAYGIDMGSLEAMSLMIEIEYAVIAAQVIANTPRL